MYPGYDGDTKFSLSCVEIAQGEIITHLAPVKGGVDVWKPITCQQYDIAMSFRGLYGGYRVP